MNRRSASIMLLAIAVSATSSLSLSPALAQSAPPARAVAPASALPADSPIAKIRDEGLNRSQVMKTLSHLTDVLGPRLTGSPNLKAANEWTKDQLTKYGLVNAHLESWPFNGRGWAVKRFQLQVLEPQQISLIASPRPWSPGIEKPTVAPAILLEARTEEELQAFKGKLKGAIVLNGGPRAIQRNFAMQGNRLSDEELSRFEKITPGTTLDTQPPPTTGPGGAGGGRGRGQTPTLARGRIIQFLMEEGALMELSPSTGDAGILKGDTAAVPSAGAPGGRGGTSYAANAPATLPQAILAVEHYNRLVRIAQEGVPIKLDADLQTQYFTDDTNAYNTLAEIPGTDLKDEIVMVGAHLDSWYWGTGATDNGAGSAIAMESVRILKALNLPTRRTIRIALWSGEELGMQGSRAYARQHFGGTGRDLMAPGRGAAAASQPATSPFLPEHEKFSVYLNSDEGAGKIRGIYVGNNPAAADIFRKWLAPLADLGADTVTLGHATSTDHISFEGVGLPAFHFIQDPLDYWTRTIHTSQDLYDRAPPEDMKVSAIVMALCAYEAAMADQKMPRR